MTMAFCERVVGALRINLYEMYVPGQGTSIPIAVTVSISRGFSPIHKCVRFSSRCVDLRHWCTWG